MDIFDLRAYLKKNTLKKESIEFNTIEDINNLDELKNKI